MPENSVIMDRQAAAIVPTASEITSWASSERAFISSVMPNLVDERRAVATAVSEIGAEPVMFRSGS